MNRTLDRKVAAASHDLSGWVARAINTIALETNSTGSETTVDYAEVADVCSRLLWQIAQYNTLVKVRAELGEE
jgi:hypothetical protein